jgi:hypothetical protein
MSLVQNGRLEIKLGSYAIGNQSALTDPLLVNKAQDYRRHIAARMIPLDASEIAKRFPKADYHVSLKVDGEFSLLVFDANEAILVNPGGTVRTGLPLLKEAVETLKKAGVKKAIFAGEFHYVRPDAKRPRVHDVSKVSRSPQTQAEVDGLNFAVFDVLEVDGATFQSHRDAWNKLSTLFAKGKLCKPVEAHWLENGDSAAIEKLFKKWVGNNQEGAVVRSESVGSFKLKPRHSIDCVVIGYTEGTDDRVGMIHDLLIAMMRPDGSLHVVGHVGGGFTEQARRDYLSDLKDMPATSEYVEVNDQVAYHMVQPKWIIEVSILDVLSQTTRSLPISKMVLTWDAQEKKYNTVRRLPSVGLISPQFVRRREDKQVNVTDIRMQQVADLVEVPLLDKDAKQMDLPKSVTLKREVYTKVLKGQTMLRKLILIKTNKETEGDFPAFVVHYTDYSPNRKTPLEREVRVSNSQEQIDVLWKELAEEAFVKGWVALAGSASAGSASSSSASSPTASGSAVASATPAKEPKAKSTKSKTEKPADDDTAEEKTAPKKRASKKKEA